MFIAYCIVAVLYSGMLVLSGVSKLQHHPEAVAIIHQLIGVPLAFFPVLALLELAAAAGLLAGIRWAQLGIAAAIGAGLYFVGAIISHLLVGDVAGISSPLFMLGLAATLLLLRLKLRAKERRPAL